MMAVRVFVAGEGAPRSLRPLWRSLLRDHPGPDFSDVLILTPHRAQIRKNRRVLMEETPDAAFVPPRQLPLDDWLKTLLPPEITPIAEEERLLLLVDLLLQDRERWTPLTLGQDRLRLPQARQLLRVLDDLRLWALDRSPEDLRRTLDEAIGTYPRVAERALATLDLLEAYQNRLREAGVVDSPEALQVLLERPGRDTSGLRFLVFQGLSHLTPLLRKVLERLVSRALAQGVRVWALVPVAPPLPEPPFLRWIRTLPGAEEHPLEPLRHPTLEGRVYGARVDELRDMAREIKTLLLQHPEPLRVGIVAPSLYELLPLLQQVLREYGLEAVTYAGEPLAHTPWARLWNLATQVVLQGFPTDLVETLLSSPVFQEPRREDLLRILRQRVSTVLLEGLLPYQGLSRQEAQTLETFLQNLRNTLAPVAEDQRLGLNRWGILVRRFFQRYTAPMPPEVEQAFARALTTLERLESWLLSPEMSAREFLHFWQTLLQSLRLPDPERPEPEHPIHLMGMAEAQAFEGDLLYIVDATEDRLPSVGLVDRYLPRRVREALGLPTQEQLALEQEFRFRTLLTAPFQRVVVSYSQTDDQGNPVLPTLLADDLFPRDLSPRRPREVFARGALSPAEVPHPRGPELAFFPPMPSPEEVERWLDLRNREIQMTHLARLGNTCDYRWYLRHLVGLEEPPHRALLPLVDEGTWFHHLLKRVFQELHDDFFERRRSPSREDFLGRFRHLLDQVLRERPLVPAVSAFLRNRALEKAPDLWAHLQEEIQEGLWPSALERPVRLPLPRYQVTLVGRIDRVDRSPDGLRFRVLDYKTGRHKSASQGDASTLQVYGYTVVLWREAPGSTPLKPQILALGDRRLAREVSLPRLSRAEVHENLAATQDLLQQRIEQLLQAEFPPTTDGWLCQQCPFREVCPYARA